MFTGITTDIGTIVHISGSDDLRMRISAGRTLEGLELGASVSCSGVCLTVSELDPEFKWFGASVSQETLSKTTIRYWEVGDKINLERSLRVGDELGGHIVSGHVDDIAEIESAEHVSGSLSVSVLAPDKLAVFIAQKGSVALNGVSLTVNQVEGSRFAVNLIPHTLAVTTWGQINAGDKVNLEVDVLARYFARYREVSEALC